MLWVRKTMSNCAPNHSFHNMPIACETARTKYLKCYKVENITSKERKKIKKQNNKLLSFNS